MAEGSRVTFGYRLGFAYIGAYHSILCDGDTQWVIGQGVGGDTIINSDGSCEARAYCPNRVRISQAIGKVA